ncbi:ArsR family transcriptional regulator [Streptomyces sp. NPDC001941]|uniref:ArsR/SmtB family transcription factor n=1 Tax=Streptomyces sp. NPDC001941 TaxID=3154659 RepID=UPI00332D1697
MKRIHFTAQDLMRTRVATTIGAAAETLDSVKLLKDRAGGIAFRRWAVSVRGRPGEQARPLAALLPSTGPDVDVWSLAGDSPCVDEAVDTLLSAPRALIRAEFEHVEFDPAYRSWGGNLVDGDREAWLQVAAALRASHRVAVAPYWGRIRSHLAETRAAYAGALAGGGVEHLLASLDGPLLRWRPPVLEVRHRSEADVHLDGRGLVIVPTLFSVAHAEVLRPALDPARPLVLAVPSVTGAALGNALWEGADTDDDQSIEDLLGRTRAAVLGAAVGGGSTTDLARRLSISPATVSHHTSVLRNAGLVTTRREGKAVLHSVTSLGMALLEPGSRLL